LEIVIVDDEDEDAMVPKRVSPNSLAPILFGDTPMVRFGH